MLIDYLKKLITPDMVFFGVPSGQSGIVDLTGKNPKGQCFGTHPNVPVIAPPIDQISACDAIPGWTGTNLSIDTSDKKEGTGSLKDTVATPGVGLYYTTTYNPTGIRDWSTKEDILLWVYCDRASTAFSPAFHVVDTSSNRRYWYLTFSAGEWAAIKLPFSTPDVESGAFDPTLIAEVRVIFRATDETPFYKKLDDLRLTGYPSLINPSVGWNFDKVDDRIIVPHDSSLNLTDEISIIAWIYPRTSGESDRGRIIDKTRSTAFTFSLMTGNNFYFEIAGNYIVSPVDIITLNEWNFIGVNYHGTNRSGKFFLNAQEAGDIGDLGAMGINTDPLYIGNHAALTRTFDGYIALIALARKAWSQQQYENFYLATKGLFAPRG